MNIIAEIGTSHGGSFEKAKELIYACKEAGADSVKFQWVYADEILHPDTGFVNLPGGKIPLYNRFKDLEVSPEFFQKCLEYTHSLGMKFICSPFGLKSLKELCEIKPDALKIASPEVNHIPLLKKISEYYKKIPIILSSGVSKLGDIEKAIEILTDSTECAPENFEIESLHEKSSENFKTQTSQKKSAEKSENFKVNKKISENQNKDEPLTLLHCSTFYPTPEEEYNVKCVKTLHEIFGLPTGISDHSLNPVLVPVLSTAMGATIIEKHITLSKKYDGLDDPVALEIQEFAFMVHCVHQTQALINRFENDEIAKNNGKKNLNFEISNACFQEILNQLKESFSEEKIFACLGNGVKKLSKSESENYGRTNRSLHYLKDLKKGHKILPGDIGILRTEKILTQGIHPENLKLILGSELTKDVKSGDGVQFEDFMIKDI